MAYRLLMRSVMSLATLTVAVAVLLSGCVPQDPDVVPPPELSTEPVFATDEEALAAATDAYKAYQLVLNEISRDGGAAPERIASVVTAGRLEKEIEGLVELAGSGRRLVGEPIIDQAVFQQLYVDQSGGTVVVIYACVEPSGARILDSSGKDVTPVELEDAWPREATFHAAMPGDPTLLLADETAWDGGAIC